jgi:hypothetical protein
VVNNPGTIPDSHYLDGPDMTVVFEGTYKTYQTENLGRAILALQNDTADRTVLACIIHSAPVGVEKWRMKEVVEELQKLAGSVFVTERQADFYSSFGSCWEAFVVEMDWTC